MIRTLYILTWFFLVGSAMVSVFKGTLSAFGMVVFGLIALALVHGLALWSVIVNTRDVQPE